MAPEILSGKYDKKCDVWSCGVLLYILLCGMLPFSGNSNKATFDAIQRAELEFFSPQWDNISEEAKDLISNMLERDINRRFTMEACFNHNWVQQRFNDTVNDHTLHVGSLENLKTHRASRKLEQAVITFITSQLTSIDETYELKKVFTDLDVNGDGKLSIQELREGYQMFGFESFDEVEQIMITCDVDGSGFLDYTEFISATLNRSKLLSKEKLEGAFNAFDVDGSGSIGIYELKEMMEKQDKLAEDSEWHEVIKEADSNGDGEIDFVEFKDLMLRLL